VVEAEASTTFGFINAFCKAKSYRNFALCTLHFICRKANNSSGISPAANILRLAAATCKHARRSAAQMRTHAAIAAGRLRGRGTKKSKAINLA
jgi:hypothetical protein